jgi:hypothetical protein
MVEQLARLGYASKALIYAIVGGLALAAATNQGGRITDTSGALRVVLSQPFGRFLLVVLGIGLCGYAVWRFLDAFRDPDRRGTAFNGLVVRIGNAIRGFVYGGLGLEAFRLVRGLGGSSGKEAELWAARIMDWPLGAWLIGIGGLIIAVYGVSEVIDSLKGERDELVDLTCLPRSWRLPADALSRFGVGARGVIIVVLGIFLVRAALQHDPSEAAGTRESVTELANAISGRWLLAAIGLGFVAYAVDQATHAWCRRIRRVL